MKKLIIAEQNETIRTNQYNTTALCTINLVHCIAVLIYDREGNASLTQVDSHTDLSFIAREVEKMKGAYYVNLIKDKEDKGSLEEKVIAYIAKEYGNIRNSINRVYGVDSQDNLVFKVADHCVMFSKGKCVALMAMQLRAAEDNDFADQNPALKGALDSFKYEDGAHLRLPLCRRFSRQLRVFLRDEEALPEVTYDAGWTGSFYQMSKDLVLECQSYMDSYTTKERAEANWIKMAERLLKRDPLEFKNNFDAVIRIIRSIQFLETKGGFEIWGDASNGLKLR